MRPDFSEFFCFTAKKRWNAEKKGGLRRLFSSFRLQLRQHSRERWAVSVREVRMDIAVCELHPLAVGQADEIVQADVVKLRQLHGVFQRQRAFPALIFGI